MTAPYEIFDPLLGADEARAMVGLCEAFGTYGLYSEEALNDGIGEGLPQRFDAAFNFVKTGGRFGRKEELAVLASRTNYFRETYAYGEQVFAPGIESFFHNSSFIDAARRIHGRTLIEPAIVYANILLPGQELAVHTDVPEFRGANRKILPQWLLVVMHHSGLFDAWRMPIATVVAWFHDARGGEFAFYPEGPDGPPTAHPVRFNTAIITDTDTVFHGVDRVLDDGSPMPPYRPGMKLTRLDDGEWLVREGDEEVSRCTWADMRFSVSWKAYCFVDESDRERWLAGSDDLSLDFILDRLDSDMRERGVLSGERPSNHEFAGMLVDTYIHFPPAVAA